MLAATETMNCWGLNTTFEGGEVSVCLGCDDADWNALSLGLRAGFEDVGVSGFSSSFVAIDRSGMRQCSVTERS